MLKKVLFIALSAALLVGAGLTLTACDGGGTDVSSNPVQAFIDNNREMLDAVSADHLESLGPGATVDFQAGDGEFIYIYTWGPGPTVEDLKDVTTSFLDMPDNVTTYETLANNLAGLIGLDTLKLTVSYYDGQGNLIMTRSFDGHASAATAE